MTYRERKRGGWKIVLAIVAIALLSCGVLIALDMRKIAVEKKVESKFAPPKTMGQPGSTLPPLPRTDN